MDLLANREKAVIARVRRKLEGSEFFDDLRLLRELDDAGRVPGQPVESLEEALDYLRGLETESYLEGNDPAEQGGLIPTPGREATPSMRTTWRRRAGSAPWSGWMGCRRGRLP